MKKIYLFFFLCCIAALGLLSPANLQAQTWTAPTLTGSAPVSGTTYYIYNVGSNGYLNRGGWWAMMSVVTASPTANAGAAIIKWTAVNTSGSTWTFQYNSDGSDVSNNYLFAASTTDGSIYTDNSTDNTWDVVLTDATTQTYSIQVVSTYGGYNATQYLGSASTTESTNKGIVTVVRSNRASGDNYTQWRFVSQADLDLYNARVLLDRYMNYAKTRGGIDISSYITTYDAGVTADINTAAADLLIALGRTSVTVPNFSFEDDAVQTGWTNSGSFVNQTNTPGLFTKDGTNYTEKWTNSGSNLGTGTITQTITGLANGLYGLVAAGHAVQQAGGNPLHTGAFFTAGTSSTEISSGGDYNVDYAIVANATGGSDGTLNIGYALSGTVACNWTGFDNFRLYYYGAIATPILTASESSFLLDDIVLSTDTFTVTGLNLTDAITLTAPSGITLSTYSIPANPTAASVIATYDGTTAVNGNITLTSGTNVVNISVIAASNAGCYTPLFASGNLVADPYLNSLSTFGGWGTKSINTDPAYVYCGTRSGHVNGGSIDQVLTGNLKTNTTYRVKAMVYAVSGTIQVGVFGWSEGQSDISHVVSTYGSWETVDFTFTTGATLGASQGVFFNNADGYIDNFEIYEGSLVGVDNVIAEAVNVYPNPAPDYIMIKGISGVAQVDIINMQGKTLKVVDNVVANSEINLGDLSKGSYIVKITTKNRTTYKMVLLNK